MNQYPPKSSAESLHQLRLDAEEHAVQPLKTPAIVSEKDQLLYELQVHQIELETQNEQLRQAVADLAESNERYLNLFEFSPVGYLTLDAHGLITEVNLPAALILGTNRNKLLLCPFSRYMTPKSADHHHLKLLKLSESNEPQSYDIEIKREDGSLRNVQLNLVKVASEDGPISWHIALLDFTEKKNLEDAFQDEKEKSAAELIIANKELRFQNAEKEKHAAELIIANKELRIAATAFESQAGIFVTNADNVILRINKAFTDITGYSAEEAVGQSPQLLSSGKQNRDFYTAMWQRVNSTGTWDGEVWNRRKNGEVYPEHLSITAIRDANNIVSNYVATLNDITEAKAAADEIMNLAFYDQLTQLPNRRLMLDRLRQALATSTRSGLSGALLFLDLDHFKTLNDTQGHDVGDILLQQVAARLTAGVRDVDTVARIGGDEFVILLESLSEEPIEAAAKTKVIAEKIILSLKKPYHLNALNYRNTASIGATLFMGREQQPEELLKQADIAMYQAKTSGRNTLRFFDQKMQEAITSRANMENELRKAIEQHQFQLFYQIQVDSLGHTLGAEVLIRWQNPQHGNISPSKFIPLAEDTGLILPIGQWVIDAACAQLKMWQQNPLSQDLTLAVNVSAKQFHQAFFVDQVKATLERHKINPTRLKLELTETMLVENIKDIIIKMKALSKIGIRFSLDDFGTGYSSLQYLKELPLDQLKIDKSFVRDIATNASDRAIVRTIITMASSLGINVIAEGVETEEQRQFLSDNGCKYYQGYLFSKPIAINKFEALLKTTNL